MQIKDGVLLEVKNEDLSLLYSNPQEFWQGVRAIGDEAFTLCEGLEKIEIPEGVIVIGENAFSNCKELHEVKLPESLKQIRHAAFSGCGKLEKLDIPDNVRYIGGYAFRECGLKYLKLPKRLKDLGDDALRSAFYLCENLEKIEIPDSVTFAGTETFYLCRNLKSAKLSKRLKNIEYAMFCGCEQLESVEIPSSVRVIDALAFCKCKSIKTVIIPEHVKSIGKSAFFGCDSLEKIVLPKKIDSIGYNAFELSDDMYISLMGSKDESYPNKFVISKESSDDSKVVSSCKVGDIGFSHCLSYLLDNMRTTSNPILKEDEEINNYLVSNGIKLPYGFVQKLKEDGQLDNFISNTNLENFINIQKKITVDAYGSEDELLMFYTFAYNIGCFSKDHDLNNKANEWLENVVFRKDGKFVYPDIMTDVLNAEGMTWKIMGENKEFSEFLFGKDDGKKETRIETLESMSDGKGIKLMKMIYDEYAATSGLSFLDDCTCRDEKTGKLMFRIPVVEVDENGKRVRKTQYLEPSLELFAEHLTPFLYDGIEDIEDRKISKELSKWGTRYDDSDFEVAKKIMKKRATTSPKTSIVGTHLSGMAGEIEKYKSRTDELRREGVESASEVVGKLSEVIQNNFTYDWLEKNDPQNLVLGLYCHCRDSLSRAGDDVMRESILNPDCQNLVIRDKNGVPVAKALMYVNRKQRYAVFYTVHVANGNRENKEQIYETYMAGVRAFAEEYNKKNPKRPLRKINVGMMDGNDLIDQISRGRSPSKLVKGVNFNKYFVFPFFPPGKVIWGMPEYGVTQYTIWENEKEAKKGR